MLLLGQYKVSKVIIVFWQNQVIKAKKKIAEENIRNAVKVALEEAEVSSSDGKAYCVTHVNVAADTAAIREAVVKVTEQKVKKMSPPCKVR